VLEVLRTGPKSLGSVVSGSEGAYPTEVLETLRKLQEAGSVTKTEENVWLNVGCGNEQNELQIERDFPQPSREVPLPEPHPLDFDWRFDLRTLDFLNRLVEEMNPKSVGILGAPTLFRYLTDQGKEAHLFDKNAQVIEFLKGVGYKRITECDLFGHTQEAEFECVVADPPWYLPHYGAFLAAARRLLIPGGKLLISVLPRLTRPSAEVDRHEIAAMAFRNGFDLVRSEPGTLHYASPPFEAEALKTDGLDLPAWRAGDLCTYVRSTREVPPALDLSANEDASWRTYHLGLMSVKVKWVGDFQTGIFRFEKVTGAASMRLGSVSRRSPVRFGINLWTSRNLALQVTRPDLVCQCLELLVEGYDSAAAATAVASEAKLSAAEFVQLRILMDILVNESAR
jgi:SAM-dependent methyltransferase